MQTRSHLNLRMETHAVVSFRLKATNFSSVVIDPDFNDALN
jgi:hypothetical protein